jgi:hypothetical protein
MGNEEQVIELKIKVADLQSKLESARTDVEVKNERIDTLIERRLEAKNTAKRYRKQKNAWHRRWYITVPIGLAVGVTSTALITSETK